MTKGLAFTPQGELAPGDYVMTFAELRRSLLVVGPGPKLEWDRAWRETLVSNLEILVRQLWQAGVVSVFADGSFVSDKVHPEDIDGYFECSEDDLATGRLVRELNLLDPYKVWTWEHSARRHAPGSLKPQLPMWHRYRVELYPHFGQGAGIRDRHGQELTFPAAFRLSRANKPRGIVKLAKGGTDDPQ
jgi:hypothetical protein